MIKREYVEAELARWGSVPRHELPRHFRKPKTERDFAVGFLLSAKSVMPDYDDDGNLTGFRGVRRLRDEDME